jgi:hypothetical protein
MAQDRLEEFGNYELTCQSFDDFWTDSEIIGGLTATINAIESKRAK